jgi:hypothetical protein
MVRIAPGTFTMGEGKGIYGYDELPLHKVHITDPFHMAATEVTNAQYERFDPEHRQLRGKRGFSAKDDEAVVFVSWNEANAFCRWLREKENRPYRLPTEAEWEYACRAGTKTSYHTGDALPAEYHKNQNHIRTYEPVEIRVGVTPPNAWGLCDMHGNVEEWCSDWYGPYVNREQTNPLGYAKGIMKVTRGGSHSTDVEFLRSANRMGTLPEDKSWLIGFRVVMGKLPEGEPLPAAEKPLCMKQVSQKTHNWSDGPDRDKPFFAGPIQFLQEPSADSGEPFFSHNHCPSITWCDNGDLLTIWFSTEAEKDRGMVILGSRLRPGSDTWEPASLFYKAPDRNMTGSSLFNDGKGKLYHFNGLDVAYHWRHLAMTLRTSTDNGATWSAPRLIGPEHGFGNQVISGTSRTPKGLIIQACDAGSGGSDGTVIHLSRDGGRNWICPSYFAEKPEFTEGGSGGYIAK